jgi:hypothetical protein
MALFLDGTAARRYQLSAPKTQARSEEASLPTNDFPFVLERRVAPSPERASSRDALAKHAETTRGVVVR